MRRYLLFSIIAVLPLFILSGCTEYEGLSAEEWADQYYEIEEELEHARQTIDDLNYTIEDAQSYAWSSYEDMGYALESLETF